MRTAAPCGDGMPRGHHDDSDRSHVGRAVAEATAAPVDGTRVHARGATDALQRTPEAAHPPESLRSTVVDEHDVHIAASTLGPAEVGGVLGDALPPAALCVSSPRMNTAELLKAGE